MKKNKKISIYLISGIIITLVSIICIIPLINKENMSIPNNVYQIYLDGKEIGLIDDDDDFYTLINKEQSELKELYQVDQVYPPNGFEIVPINTYENKVTTVEEIYNTIKEEHSFTIKGYEITIKSENEDEEIEIIELNVLKEEIFNEAMLKYITTFVDEDDYNNYIGENQDDIDEIGEIIESMYFEETITIKDAYIDSEEKIYNNSAELIKYLLFGDNVEIEEYKVKSGDDLESIAYDNKLSVQELLIANEEIKSKDSIIAVDQIINVALINPQITLTYDLKFREVVEQPFEVERIMDPSKYSGYQKTTVQGINGLQRVTGRVTVINGEMNQGAVFDDTETEVIRLPQNQVIVYGTSGGSYVPTGDSWGYPTNFPYYITSEYGYRWGTIHDGIDISGQDKGSPIYAVLDGVVINAGWGGIAGNNAGYNVVIEHYNGYYTVYAHMSFVSVNNGDTVNKGTILGGMGSTGYSTGTHLHLGVFIGKPYNGGYAINPRRILMF